MALPTVQEVEEVLTNMLTGDKPNWQAVKWYLEVMAPDKWKPKAKKDEEEADPAALAKLEEAWRSNEVQD